MTDPNSILPLTATASLNPFESSDTRASVETERRQRSLIRNHLYGEAVDVRLHQRNGRKTLTTIEGLPKDIDPKKVLKVFKKDFACNGCIVQDEDSGVDIIQLQGDHRQKAFQMLVEGGICKKEDMQIHGF